MRSLDLDIIEVVEFTSEIGDTLRRLVAQLDGNFQPLSDTDVQEMIDAPGTHVFVAKLKQAPYKIVGMYTLIYYRIPYKRKGWIEDVVVDEAYRRKGFAKMMLNHGIEEAKRLGIKSLNLTSSPEREFANKLYLQLGFKKRSTNVYRKNFDD